MSTDMKQEDRNVQHVANNHMRARLKITGMRRWQVGWWLIYLGARIAGIGAVDFVDESEKHKMPDWAAS